MAEQPVEALPEFKSQGILEGHNGWVTVIVAGNSDENKDSAVLISGSRDKTIIIWKLYNEEKEGYFGLPFKSLTGHSHFVSDLALTSDNGFLISSSWDKTLRLWDLREGFCKQQFSGHSKEVFTVAYSADNRKIISGGSDRDIKLWNNHGKVMDTTKASNHQDWVSCIRFSPKHKVQNGESQYFVSGGWDGRLKIWNANSLSIEASFKAHEGNINSVTISPNGKFICTGGKDKRLLFWDKDDLTNTIRDFDAGAVINQIAFNPSQQFVSVATEKGIKVWDLMRTDAVPIFDYQQESSESLAKDKNKEAKKIKEKKFLSCTSLCWQQSGKKLFAGFTDGKIRVFQIENKK